MQPYLFPYLGYWQLINVADVFVIYDDVNFIKQGFINRNYLLGKNKPQVFTLELLGASSNRLINEIEVGRNRKKLIKTICQNYIKAPYFREVMPLLEEILTNEEKNLAFYVGHSIQRIAEFLNLEVKFLYSSEIKKNCELRAQDKVIDICKNLNASVYINAIGGQKLYSKDEFKKNNIVLNFIKTDLSQYKQFGNDFVPNLSIIDVMMFNDVHTINSYLESYQLV
jgi:hypothetical protein